MLDTDPLSDMGFATSLSQSFYTLKRFCWRKKLLILRKTNILIFFKKYHAFGVVSKKFLPHPGS